MPSTYSPFRYPGGKSQLYSFVKNILDLNNVHGTYIEPFGGGSAIGLKLLLKHDVNQIVINDLDSSIYSVWRAILNHPDFLIKQIQSVPFDYYDVGNDSENIVFWKKQRMIYLEKAGDPTSLVGAFATLFLNRTNRSGIIMGGPIGGWSQKRAKINARFNKKTLIDKIQTIYAVRDQIELYNLDALDLIPRIQRDYSAQETFVFFDPPYIVQGSHLYLSSLDIEDHAKLADKVLALKYYKWIVTYDHEPIAKQLYESATGRYEYQLTYSANSKNRGKASEYLFSSPSTRMQSFGKTIIRPL